MTKGDKEQLLKLLHQAIDRLEELECIPPQSPREQDLEQIRAALFQQGEWAHKAREIALEWVEEGWTTEVALAWISRGVTTPQGACLAVKNGLSVQDLE